MILRSSICSDPPAYTTARILPIEGGPRRIASIMTNANANRKIAAKVMKTIKRMALTLELPKSPEREKPAHGRAFGFRCSGGRICPRGYAAQLCRPAAPASTRTYAASRLCRFKPSSFGSGGSLCTLATAHEPLAVLKIPLIAA